MRLGPLEISVFSGNTIACGKIHDNTISAHTKMATTVPQILRIVVARVHAHAIRKDSRKKPFVVVDKIFWTCVSHAKCSGLTERTDITAPTYTAARH